MPFAVQAFRVLEEVAVRPIGKKEAAQRVVSFLGVSVVRWFHAAIFFFGLGWINLGDLGVSVGYPVFMSFAIIVGNAILIVGVCLLTQGKAMMPG